MGNEKFCLNCAHAEIMGVHLRALYLDVGIKPAGMNLRCSRTRDVLVGDSVHCATERAEQSPPRYPGVGEAQCGPTGIYFEARDDGNA